MKLLPGWHYKGFWLLTSLSSAALSIYPVKEGNNIAASMAKTANTTISSIKVNPFLE